MRIRRLIRILLVAGCVTVLAVGIGHAAGLTLSAEKLTSVAEASTVPISTCSLSISNADTYADQASSGSNFGANTTMLVQSRNLSRNRRSYVKFDVASCSIPAAAEVKTATLTLNMTAAPSQSRTYGAWRVTSSWLETDPGGLDWGVQPTVAGAATNTIATGTSTGDKSWNVQADVAAYVAGSATNYGWRIRDETESQSSTAYSSTFRTRENGTAALRPRLTITYYP
jgi:hypothetical protein